ncbi:hypothetical protein SEA_ODYSSEY395_107 [Arthrobacter phage Odyssey395]|nr:hypothetical protein SEA_ODYSSEY395_107 [Arthrobacter phage Odyssey395]
MPDPRPALSYIHYYDNGYTLCEVDPQWQVKTTDISKVTCPDCLQAHAAWGAVKTAKPPALTTHLRRPTGLRTYCDDPDGERRAYGVITTDLSAVDCRDCLRAKAIETAGAPAVVHHATPFADRTTCGLERWDNAQREHRTDVQTNALHGNVTCPECITIESREAEFFMTDDTPEAPTEEGYTPSQEEITEAHRHDWAMVDGPKWPHDCDGCTYLGTRWHTVNWDLYFCDQGGRPTVIARRGESEDYISGIEFIDREPMLALAYIRAVQAGLYQGPAS